MQDGILCVETAEWGNKGELMWYLAIFIASVVYLDFFSPALTKVWLFCHLKLLWGFPSFLLCSDFNQFFKVQGVTK